MTTSNIPTEQPDPSRHPGPPLIALGTVYMALFIASLVASIAMAGGSHFPSPFGPEALARTYFSEHANAVLWSAFFQFGAAVPLGLFTATITSRLRFLGISAAGVTIALFGGLAASFFLMLSALTQWVLAQPGVFDSAEAVRTLHLLAFATGGPGHVVPLGLLLAGVSVTAGITRLLPRWLMWFGVVLAILAELSTLTLVWPAAAYLLPLARFPGFIWILCAAALLPKSRQRARS